MNHWRMAVPILSLLLQGCFIEKSPLERLPLRPAYKTKFNGERLEIEGPDWQAFVEERGKSVPLDARRELLRLQVRSLYGSSRVPYPGMITKEEKCFLKDRIGKIETRAVGGYFTGYSLFANERKVPGVCLEEEIRFRMITGFAVRDHGDYFKIDLYHKSDPMPALNELLPQLLAPPL